MTDLKRWPGVEPESATRTPLFSRETTIDKNMYVTIPEVCLQPPQLGVTCPRKGVIREGQPGYGPLLAKRKQYGRRWIA